MKRCPKCNYPNPDNRETCFDCHTSLDAAPAEPEPLLCVKCGLLVDGATDETPLCPSCRKSLSRYRLPAWVWACCGVVLLMLIYSVAMFPGSLRYGVLLEKGQRAEAIRDYQTAIADYRQVLDKLPGCTLALARIGICQCKMKDVAGATDTLSRLSGRKIPAELAVELESASQNLGAGISIRRQ